MSSSLDFALKDFYRKRHTIYPLLIIIILVIAFTEFLIYFTISLGLNAAVQTNSVNIYYYSGVIQIIYRDFNTFIQILLVILSIIIVIAVTTTLVISKENDLAIMKSLGTPPRKMYNLYLTEVYVLFLIGFFLGWFFGLLAFGLYAFIMFFFDYSLIFQIDLVYTPIIFFFCLIGIYFITGYVLRKIVNKTTIKNFSRNIPYNYNSSKKLTFILKWLSKISFNFKIAITNTLRKKGEFKRYIIIFFIITLIIFTLGLSSIVLKNSFYKWIYKSQNDNLIIIGHENVVHNYYQFYQMFSDPTVIDVIDINLTETNYLFNPNKLNGLKDIIEVEEVEERLINFYDVQEMQGFGPPNGQLKTVGSNRRCYIPIIGLNPITMIQNYEIQGNFFTEENAYDKMVVGNSLAYNLFDSALEQSLKISPSDKRFHISGVIFDTFFCGWAGYINLNESRKLIKCYNNEINIAVLKISSGTYHQIKDDIEQISVNIGSNFTYLRLDDVLQDNLNYVSNLFLYPILSIIIISMFAILSLYNYQKAGIMEKAKDFFIMRAIGSKTRSLKKILFLESLFVLIPSLLLTLSVGMIFNSLFLIDRVYLPSLRVPFILFFILFCLFMIFNFLSLIPIIKKVKSFSINDFSIG